MGEAVFGIGALLCVLVSCLLILWRLIPKAIVGNESETKYVSSNFNPVNPRKHGKVRPEVEIQGEPEEEPEWNRSSPNSSEARSPESSSTSFGTRRYTQAQSFSTGPDPEHEGWTSRPHPDEAAPMRGKSRVRTSQSSNYKRCGSQPPSTGINNQGSDPSTPCKVRGQQASRSTANDLSPVAQALIANMLQRLDAAWGAPLEERKRVFRELQRDLHPDKNMDSEADAQAAKVAFQRLMERRAGFLLVG